MWSEKEVVDQAAKEFEEVGHSPPIQLSLLPNLTVLVIHCSQISIH